jgi:hypothetical protein
MAMFVFHAAYHLRHFVVGAEGGWPVGDRQAGVVAGDERSGDDQDEGGASGEDGEAVQAAVVRDFDALQNGPRGRRDTAVSVTRSKKIILSDRFHGAWKILSFPSAEGIHDLNAIDYAIVLKIFGEQNATSSLLCRSQNQSIPKRKRMQAVEINRRQNVCHLGNDDIEFRKYFDLPPRER